MHGAALAAAEPVLAPENLVHHAVDVAALGDAMAVAAMRGGDGVAVVEMHADADARRLLAGIKMHEAGDVAGRELLVHPLLEFADQPHAAVGGKKLVARKLQA